MKQTSHEAYFTLYTPDGSCQAPGKTFFSREQTAAAGAYWRGEKGGAVVTWKKTAAAVCLLAAVAALPAPAPRWTAADAAVPLEVGGRPPLVALTFDDGPRGDTTGALLDGLALREVPATFFLVGSRLEGREELVARMAAEGHQVGVHTYDHTALTGLSRRDYDAQVGKTRAALAAILGDGDFWLRPPYGMTDDAACLWAGSPVILWSVDPEDWRDQDVERIVGEVVEHVEDGSIILLHDIYPSSVQAALQVVDILLERGCCFVTVEQLMERRGVEPEAGRVYRRFPPACQ